MSKKIAIEFDESQRSAFKHLRNILSSEEVILSYPDFKLPFDLTTANHDDISHIKRLRAQLRYKRKGIVSHCLGYREITKLPIWLQRNSNFRTFAISERNTNAKINRLKAFIEEHNAKVFYKPGKENFMADALSRQNINSMQNEPQSDVATVHSEVSLTYTVESTDKPLNCFRNQIIVEEASQPSRRSFIIFGSIPRHIIHFNNKDSLLELVKEVVNVNVVNAIHCDLHTLACIQLEFPASKFWHCKRFVNDITDANEQSEIITFEHNRAHRAAQENVKQVLQDYYFPKMNKLANEVVIKCKTCTRAKYDRHPKKQELGVTPIPSYAGEMPQILHRLKVIFNLCRQILKVRGSATTNF